jgi:probable HAF family extracellular repeat protein
VWGQVVGSYTSTDTNTYGFIYSNGTVKSLAMPLAYTYNGGAVYEAATYTVAVAINASGQIVGNYKDTNGNEHGFLTLSANSILNANTIDPPNSTQTTLTAINASGEIIGEYLTPETGSNERAFLYNGGNYTPIDVPNSVSTQATAINASGQIAGFYTDSSGYTHGFIDNGGVFTTIDVPNSTRTQIFSINDAGQIAGDYLPAGVPGIFSDGFIATPQVTPTPLNPTPPVIITGGTTSIVDPIIAGTVDPADAMGSSVDVVVRNSSNAVTQQIQNIPVNAQGGFVSRLDLPTDGQYTAVATLTTSSGFSASSNGASYTLDSTPNEPDFGTSDAAEVARLYYGLLDRAPDAGGLQGWTNFIENGGSPQLVAQLFLGSPEYANTSIGQSNAAFVQSLYSTALGRSPDAPGFQGWETALNTGTLSRADVVNGFLASSEFQSDHAGQSDAAYINEVYEVALQRPAEPQGLAGWETALSNGMSRTTFDQMVVGSAEFQSSITQPANSAFVGTLYEQALGRAPDPQGLAGWTGAINANLLNNVGVAIGIAESPEAQQFLAPRIENGWHLA